MRFLSRRNFMHALLAVPMLPRLSLAAAAAPAPAGRAREHVVVVGAGAFGGWTAWSLLRAGFRVTLVDAWGAGHARASSGGETRVIRGVYGGVQLYSEMAARALALWREAEQRWQRPLLFHTGALWLCSGDDDYVRTSLPAMQAAGLPVEELTPSEGARRYPQMSFEGVRTVFFEPEAGFLAARAACELVRENFVREGGEFRLQWARPGAAANGRLSDVRLADGSTVQADHFVFACGPWLGQVFPDVIGSRITPTRQEVFFFGPPAADARYHAESLPVWVHIGERLSYGVPAHARRGLKIADDTAGPAVDPTTLDRVPSAAGLAAARTILRERFPALHDAPLVESRVCQYEASSDGDFLVDRHPGLENTWLVGGGSGHGFKMGPALGEYVAALVQNTVSVHPRFSYPRLQPGESRP